MKIKNTILATFLLASVPLTVRAEDVNKYNNYQISCDSNAQCNNFEIDYTRDDEVAQTPRRTRTRRTRSRDDKKIYVGGTLGVFFPSEIDDFEIGVVSGDVSNLETVDPGTGFGGSLYGGYKFSNFISADIEGFVFGGDADPLDSSYTSYGFFVNPRFTYSFDPDNFRSFYVFASPGIGIAGIDFGDEISDAPGDNDDSGSGFAIQAKAGVGYPLSNTIDLIGQVRYFNAFNVIEITEFGQAGEITETEDRSFNAFSIEAGVNFKF